VKSQLTASRRTTAIAAVPFAVHGSNTATLARCCRTKVRYRILRDTIEPGATQRSEEFDVSITVAHVTPLISLLAGVLILVVPALLNYIVAIYLIIAGVVGLNEIHHFLN
jgi:DUF3096 family protein